jgi:hypothetical protein
MYVLSACVSRRGNSVFLLWELLRLHFFSQGVWYPPPPPRAPCGGAGEGGAHADRLPTHTGLLSHV